MKTRSVGLLAIAHAAADINQGSISVFLPFFIAAHRLSYAAAAAIIFALSLVSTVAQPLFGYICDRHPSPWLIPVSMLMIGCGVSLAGLAPTYELGIAAVIVSGFGIAIFHPEGARLMNFLAGEKKATGMSYFAIGGQLGFAVGPVVATAALVAWGLKGATCLIIPTIVVSALVIYSLPALTYGYATQGTGHAVRAEEGKDLWFAFTCLSLALLSRSVVFWGLNTFLPLFWIDVLHQSKPAAGTALAVLLVSSIVGNFFGGRSGDRFGYRTVIVAGFLFLAALLPLLLVIPNPHAAILVLVPIGFVLSAPFAPSVVLAQSYLPTRIGLASGITMGLAFSFGGLTTPILGWIGDHHGLRMTLLAVSSMPVLSLVLCLMLPRQKKV